MNFWNSLKKNKKPPPKPEVVMVTPSTPRNHPKFIKEFKGTHDVPLTQNFPGYEIRGQMKEIWQRFAKSSMES
jgi:hypothetical protein